MWCNHAKWVRSCAYNIFSYYLVVLGIFNATFSMTPHENWLISSRDSGSLRFCRTIESKGNFPSVWLYLKINICYTPIAFNERVTFWLQPPGHCLVRVRLLHCMSVQLHNGCTRPYVQIMQHTDTQKAVPRRVEAKKLLSHRRQSKYSSDLFYLITSHTKSC